jgi:hypothetical protein
MKPLGCVLALVVLGSSAPQVCGDEKADPQRERLDPFDPAKAGLRLNDTQQEKIRKIQEEFFKKVNPVNFRLWSTYKTEQKALLGILTDSQKAMLFETLQALRTKERQRVAAKLGLNDAQKDRLAKLADEYEPRFRVLVGREGEAVHKGIADLRLDFRAAVRAELTESQRGKMAAILREAPGMLSVIRDDAGLAFAFLTSGPAHFAQSQYQDEFAGKLGLSAEQRQQFAKIAAEYGPAIQKTGAEMLALLRQQTEAIEKVLTDEQRTGWREYRKTKGDDRN